MLKESIAPMLEHWHEFYLLIGTAAAALVALLFVAASVGAGLLSRAPDGPTRTYVSPIAFHFTSAFFVAAAALVPSHTLLTLGGLVGLNAVCGMIYSAFVMRRLFTDNIADLADRFCYGILPFAAYAAGLWAAYLIFGRSIHAPEFLAATVMLLLIVNIRNAWDLMLSLSRRRVREEAAARGEAPPTP
jgi:uncharacterized membrane protein YbhN (UPF0104 family)